MVASFKNHDFVKFSPESVGLPGVRRLQIFLNLETLFRESLNTSTNRDSGMSFRGRLRQQFAGRKHSQDSPSAPAQRILAYHRTSGRRVSHS